MLYAADFKFWEVYIGQIRASFRGEFWTVSGMARDKYGAYWMQHSRDAGYNPAPDTINGGGNSGYQAVHLAATFGASKIVLLGFDMQRTGGKHHWHGKHEGRLANGVGFRFWMENFQALARDLKARGVEVINATRETAMTCFPRAPLEEALP